MAKKLLSLIMVCFMAFAAVAQTTITFDATVADCGAATEATANFTMSKGGVTITCSGSTSTQGGYCTGQHYRFYGGTSIVLTSTVGNITNIELTSTASGTEKYGPGLLTADVGTYSYSGTVGTWTGDASTVTFSKSAQFRATKIVVTVGASDPTYVADPVFSPVAGTYYTSQQVSIASGTTGAVVYYTTDGTDPTSASTAYSSPVTVSATTTVKAIAINGDYKSNIVSAEYVIADPTAVANIAAYNAVDDNTVVKFTNPVTVLAQYNKNMYVSDDSGYALFYGSTGQTYSRGDVIPAGFIGTKATYNGKPELKVSETDGFQAATDNTTITAELIQLTDISDDLWGHLVQVNGVKYTSKNSCTDNSGTGSWYSTMIATTPDTTGNTSYNVVGIVGSYKGTSDSTITYQLLPVTNTLASGGLTISQFNALDDDATAVMGSVTALAQYGTRLFVKDETGYMLVYGSTGQTYSRGDVIPAGFSGTKTTYDGEPEFKSPSGFQAASGNVTVTPEVITLDSGVVAHANFGHLVTVKNVTIDATAGTITDASGSAPYYNNMGASLPSDLTQTYDVVAIIGSYGKTSTVYQLLPLEFTLPGGGAVDVPEVENISGVYALTQGTNAKVTGKLTAVYQSGSYLYVKDTAGTYGLVFGTLSNTFANGDEITGAVTSWKEYNGVKELIPVDSTFVKSGTGTAVEPVEVTAEDISQDMVHQYLVVNNATLTDSTLTDETGVTITLYNKFSIEMPTAYDGKKFTVKLFPTLYSSQLELYPVEVVESSGVSDVNAPAQAVSTAWYDLQGRKIQQPADGICVKVTVMSDGTTTAQKVVVK